MHETEYRKARREKIPGGLSVLYTVRRYLLIRGVPKIYR